MTVDPASLSHAERAHELLDNPSLFNELQREGEREYRYFENLSSKAARDFDFKQWLDFLRIFFGNAREGTQDDFEEELARHGKIWSLVQVSEAQIFAPTTWQD